MRIPVFATIAALSLLSAVALPAPAADEPAKGERKALKENPDAQQILADVKAIRAAREGKDKSGVKAAVEKLKADFAALPDELKTRIKTQRPQVAKLLEGAPRERPAKKGGTATKPAKI